VGLLVGGVVVPCVFTTRVDAVFVVPKLAALWAELALGLAVVATAALTGRAPADRAFRVTPVDVAVLAFVVASIAAWGASTDRRQSLYGERLQYQGLLTLLLYAGLFGIARLTLADRRGLTRLAVALACGGTLVAGYALIQRAGLDPVWDGYLPEGRVFSSIGQPNALAAYLVMVIPITASLLVIRRPWVRAALVVTLAAMALALMFTLSRGGYLAFAVTLIVLTLAARGLPGTTRARATGLAAALFAAVAIVAAVAPARAAVTTAWHRAASSTDVAGDASLRFHVDAWTVAAHIAADHPLLGTGPETFPDVFPRYSHDVLPEKRAAALDAYRVESPHNVYLAIAAGSGFPALFAYVGIVAGFLALVLRGIVRTTASATRIALVGVLAASAGHLVADAFMTADVTSTSIFWVLMGAALPVAWAEIGVGHSRRAQRGMAEMTRRRPPRSSGSRRTPSGR
jgi:putative inorganic carbon (HCO3(-)) transporter